MKRLTRKKGFELGYRRDDVECFVRRKAIVIDDVIYTPIKKRKPAKPEEARWNKQHRKMAGIKKFKPLGELKVELSIQDEDLDWKSLGHVTKKSFDQTQVEMCDDNLDENKNRERGGPLKDFQSYLVSDFPKR